MYIADFHEEEMKKLRNIIPSVPVVLEMLHSDPYNAQLGRFCMYHVKVSHTL